MGNIIDKKYLDRYKASANETRCINESDLTKFLNQLENKLIEDDFADGTLPTLFQWPNGGKTVYVTGSFNDWKEKIELKQVSREYFKKGRFDYTKSVLKVNPKPNTFYTIINLPIGTYNYNFIVNDKWRIDRNRPYERNSKGVYENILEVKLTDFRVDDALKSDEEFSKQQLRKKSVNRKLPTQWGQNVPTYMNVDGSSVEMPSQIPPYLSQPVILDSQLNYTNPILLPPPPNHVLINHILAHKIQKNVTMLTMITRHRQKYVTTTYCSKTGSKQKRSD